MKKKDQISYIPEYERKESARYYMQKDEEILFWIIKIGLYLILLTPLVVKSGVIFPFVSLKTVYFRILVEIIFAAYLFLALRFPKYRPRWNSFIFNVSLFIGVMALTTFTGVDVNRSMWSTFERMGGLFTFLHLWIFFIILIGVFQDKKEWKGILTGSVIVAAIVSIGAFLAPDSSRGGGTLGNTSFLGAYLLFNIFIAGMFLVKERGAWKIMYGIPLLIILPEFLTINARAANLSFFGGLVILFILYGLRFFKKRGKTIFVFFIVFLIISSIISGILLGNNARKAIDGVLSSATIKARLLIWKMSWEGWRERLLFGWGPENFNILFNKYFDSRLSYARYGGEVWFDRAHNIIFDIGATSGIIGLASYFLFFIGAFFVLWKKYFLTKKNFTIAAFTSVILVTYFVQNLFVFDMISTYFMFFLILAYVAFYSLSKSDNNSVLCAVKRGTVHYVFMGLIIIPLLFIMFKGNIQPLIASSWVDEANRNSYKRSFNEIIDAYNKRMSRIWWGKSEIRENLSKFIGQYAVGINGGQSFEDLRRGLLLAAKEGEEAIKESPLDIRPYLILGDIYNFLSQIDKSYIPLGEKVLRESIKLSPNNIQPYQQLGQNRLRAGDYNEAIVNYQYAVDLAPELDRSYWYLSQAYKMAGMPDLGLRSAYKAIELGYPDKIVDSFAHIGDLYFRAGDIGKAISVYEEAVEKYPTNVRIHINLSIIYNNAGYIDKAIEEAEKVGELDPSFLANSQEFINFISGDSIITTNIATSTREF